MKIFKKIISLILTAAIMVSMACVGTVSAGAAESDYSLTLDSSGDKFSVELKATDSSPLYKEYISGVMYFVLFFTCEKQNFTILVTSAGYTWDTIYGKGTSDDWINFPVVHPQSTSASVGKDYLSGGFNASFSIADSEITKLLKTCSKVELGFESFSSESTFTPELETIYTKSSSSSTSKKKISSLDISVGSKYGYTGKNVKASVTVKDGSKTLKKGTDYTLTYKNCKNIGTATVTIKGKGDYTGEKTLTYKIVPKKTTLKGTKKSDTKVNLSWTAVKGAEKYQIYYSTNGGKYKKLATASGSKTSVTLSGLDFKKNDYKFKIRSYGTDDGTKYYSSFSKVVTVK